MDVKMQNTFNNIDEKHKILCLKRDIEEILLRLEDVSNLYCFTEEEKSILDQYFGKTNETVILSILESMKVRLLNPKNHVRRRKDYFNVSTLAITFPDCHHSNDELNYLEDCYRNKIEELELRDLGIIDLKIIPFHRIVNAPFYKISYSIPTKVKKSKYNCFWSYSLDATCNLDRAKKLLKKKSI